jgi:parallel beta-helix repeat protein
VVKNVLIDDSSGHRWGGIKISEDDAIVENNIINGEIEAMDANNVVIRGNTVYATTNGIFMKGGARNTQIYNNIVHIVGNTFARGIMAGGCSCDTCFWDGTAKYEAYNAAIYNNVVINDNGSSTNSLFMFYSTSNSKIFNNVGINGRGVQYARSCVSSGLDHPPNHNPVFVNNILVDIAGGSSYTAANVTDFTGTSTINHNNFFGFSASPSQTNPITGDPLFVDMAADWHLRAGSPAIGSGTVVTLPAYPSGILTVQPTKDGVTRPVGSAWDLGIYQKGGAAGDTTPPVTPVDLRLQ